MLRNKESERKIEALFSYLEKKEELKRLDLRAQGLSFEDITDDIQECINTLKLLVNHKKYSHWLFGFIGYKSNPYLSLSEENERRLGVYADDNNLKGELDKILDFSLVDLPENKIEEEYTRIKNTIRLTIKDYIRNEVVSAISEATLHKTIVSLRIKRILWGVATFTEGIIIHTFFPSFFDDLLNSFVKKI